MDPLLKKITIGTFCLFHMMAVALYAVPSAYEELPLVQFLRHHFNDSTRPYVLVTSQWQSWPLFAPDPLRKVTRIQVEAKYPDNEWQTVGSLEDPSFGWWRYAKEIKIIERLFKDGRAELRRHYLELECKRLGIPNNTPIRLTYRYFIIPKNLLQQSTDWWHDWKPSWHESTDVNTICNQTTL